MDITALSRGIAMLESAQKLERKAAHYACRLTERFKFNAIMTQAQAMRSEAKRICRDAHNQRECADVR